MFFNMIEVKEGTLTELHDALAELVKEDLDENVKGLSDTVVVNINNLFSAKETLNLISKIQAFNNNETFTYDNLAEIDEYLSNVYSSLQSIKKDVDLDLFFKDGYTLDINKVKEKFNKKGLRAKYPEFDFDRLEELYKRPPKYLIPYYNDRKKIEVDEYVFRKYMIGLIQMVLDHMDLVIAVSGSEGCLSGDTIIDVKTNGNSSRSIKDLSNAWKRYGGKFSLYVKSYNGTEIIWQKVKNVWCTGKKATYELITESGRKIRATGTHKFLTLKGWIPLDDLNKGTKILVNDKDYIPHYEKISSIFLKTIEKVYDIECEEPYHNFVANNIIVHNSGKSTHVSQLMWMVHWIIHELKIVKYDFKIKDMFFNTLEKLRMKEDDLFDQPFRILALDEGNELHRQNWKDEEVQTFFQRLRRERYNQRIKFICIPVLGELMSSIVLSRVNFITEMKNINDTKTGSLNKGKANFYIIPRGDYIFSPAQKREVPAGEIRTSIYELLKDKNWLKGMPKEILVKTYNCNGVWGFPEKLYEEELKDTNKTFQVSKGMKMSDTEAFYMYKTGISLKAIGLDSKDVKYHTVNKFMSRLKRHFEDNTDLYNKHNLILERKYQEKGQKALKYQEKEQIDSI